MKLYLFLCLLVTASVFGDDSESTESDECQRRRDTYNECIQKPGNVTEKPEVIKALLTIRTTINVNHHAKLDILIQDITNLLASGTSKNVFIDIAYAIEDFLEDIKSDDQSVFLIKKCKIGSWGYMKDFMDTAVLFTSYRTESLVVPKGQNFDFLIKLRLQANSLTGSVKTDLLNLLTQIEGQLSVSMDLEEIYYIISEKFSNFFTEYPSYRSQCFSLKLKGRCNLRRFLDVGKRHYRLRYFKLNMFRVISPRIYPEFWYAFNTSLYQNFNAGKFNAAHAQYIYNLLSSFRIRSWSADYKLEMRFIVSRFRALFKFYPEIDVTILYNLQCGSFGSLWDLFDCTSWDSDKLEEITTTTEMTTTDAESTTDSESTVYSTESTTESSSTATASDYSTTDIDDQYNFIIKIFIKFSFGQYDCVHYLKLLISYFDGANDPAAKTKFLELIDFILSILNGVLSTKEKLIAICVQFIRFCNDHPRHRDFLFGQECCGGYSWIQILRWINQLCGCLDLDQITTTEAGCN